MNIELLQEMVRLAENRRTEALEMIERINKYNLAMIAFSGTFLSVMVTNNFPLVIVRIAGIFLILSIFVSLIAVQPKRVKAGALDIEYDVELLRKENKLAFDAYLLEVADLTNMAATDLHFLAGNKKRMTIISAIFLALSLFSTYILYAYA